MVQRLHPKSRKGFNLIEAAIVLGVVGVVIGGLWTAASSFYENKRINDTTEGVLSLCSSLTHMFPMSAAPSTGLINLDNYDVMNDLIPSNWPKLAWGHASPLSSTGVEFFQPGLDYTYLGHSVAGQIMIELNNIPPSACQKLVSSMNLKEGSVLAGAYMTDPDYSHQHYGGP